MFLGRTQELDTLNSICESSNPEIALISGRKRIGKTRLAISSTNDRDETVHYQAHAATNRTHRERFKETAEDAFSELELLTPKWRPLLSELARRNAIIILDEFHAIIDSNPEFLSKLESLWQDEIQDTGTTLVLIESSPAAVRDVLSESTFLTDRATHLHLDPLSPLNAMEFCSGTDPDTAVVAWSIYGGTPHYLQTISPRQSLAANVQEDILADTGVLHEEPLNLIRREIQNPGTYLSIMHAIACDHRTSTAIAEAAGLDSGAISTYLGNLRDYEFLERYTAVTEPEDSKRGRYRLVAPLYRFWFRYVYGQSARCSRLGDDAFDSIVAPDLQSHVDPLFRVLCQWALPRLIPAQLTALGSWWDRDVTLDILALSSDITITGTCHYTQQPVGRGAVNTLEGNVAHVRSETDVFSDTDVQYVVFSSAGFTEECREIASSRPDLDLYTTNDIFLR